MSSIDFRAEADNLRDEMVAMRRDFHMHPETAFEEVRTAGIVAEKLTELGKPPIVLTSSYFIGSEASKQRFDDCYDDYRTRVQKVYGCR